MSEHSDIPADQTKGNETSAPLILWVVPLVLVVMIPALWWTWADTPFPIRPGLVLAMTTFVALVTLVVLAALSHGFRRRTRWSLGVTSALIAIAFQWPVFAASGTVVSELTGIGLLADVVPVLFAGSLIWLATRLAGDWYFAAGLGVLAAATVLLLGSAALSLRPPTPQSSTVQGTAGPDVLILVLDAYGRNDWLQTEFGFDNSDFAAQLGDRGFDVATKATSNYARTYASLATMLNFDYVFDVGEFSSGDWDLMRSVLTGRSGLIPAFKTAGYETAYFENAWGGSQCGPAIDQCIRDGLLDLSLWNLSQMTILAPLVREIRPDPFNSISFDHLASLEEVLGSPTRDDRPRLTIAHLLLPHAPMLLNADCTRERQNDLRRWGSDPSKLDARRENYGEQTKCVNARVLEAVDRLLARDPNAVIVITADHGPGSTLDWELPVEELETNTILERMQILSAYRLPGCRDWFRDDLTPVNGIRLATNCAIGTTFDEIPDYNFWAATKTDPVVSVASVLNTENAAEATQ